ncbi:MAG: redoxin domain-containing protein [bacterium]|nr:redoxin domain-containing protein [bacterium]
MIRSPLLSLLLTSLSPLAFAQEASVDPLEGHSHCGEAFNEGPRHAAYLMPNNGSVRFPITVADTYAQRMFNQGMGQLPGFWYFEAERSFRQVASVDPECAAAYRGMAMANVDNEKRASDFAHEAWLRREQAGEHERMYVDALAASYEETSEEDRYPFPILADPEHEVFHAYRSYDDFEDMPLHGTFLIDGRGRVRWQDVSFEPFTDTDFLLAESKRLLGLPGPRAVAVGSAAPAAGGSAGSGGR